MMYARSVHCLGLVKTPGWPRRLSGTLACMFVFFFSSRRRHTRSVSAFLLNRSSDLGIPAEPHSLPAEPLFRSKIVVIDIQITLKQMLRDFIGIRVNRAKKSGMVNITSSVNSRERSGINKIGRASCREREEMWVVGGT